MICKYMKMKIGNLFRFPIFLFFLNYLSSQCKSLTLNIESDNEW